MENQATSLEEQDEPKPAPQYVQELVIKARAAAGRLASLSTAVKDQALLAMADGLVAKTEDLLAANKEDVEAFLETPKGRDNPAMADRLTLTPERIEDMAAGIRELVKQDRYVDLIIPRGGESLMKTVTEESRIPVIKHDKGICHIYVDADADPDMVQRVCVNAKVQRPSTCNALEPLLVHQNIART